MAITPTPNEKRIGPVGSTPLVQKDGGATPFFARQWQNLVDLVKSLVIVQQEIITINNADIVAGTGLDGGGKISDGTITIDMADTAVTPGSYTNADITVDQQGRITLAANGSGGVGGIDTQDDGVPVSTSATTLNFTGAGVTVTDSGGGTTEIAIPGGGGGGGSGAWEIVSDTTIGSPTASIIETDLAYDDLLVLLVGVTQASTGTISLVVSDDNGSTYKTASGDYLSVSGTGTTTNAANLPFHTTASVNPRTGNILLTAAGLAATQKVARVNGATYHIAGTENPIDAIRIAGSAGNMTGGRVIILGRSAGGGGGASLTVEEDSVPVETAVDTLNFSTAFNVTNPATGQADIDIGDVFVTYVLKAGFGVLLDTGDGSFIYAGD